jgi:small nuclear ribonucleoprotein (snRNP)-like protein
MSTIKADEMIQAYDSHCNLVLGDVEETIYIAEEEEEDQEPSVRTVKKQSEMLFVRGRDCRVKSREMDCVNEPQVIRSF